MQPPKASESLVSHGFSSRVVLPDGDKGRPLLLGEAPGKREDESSRGFHEEAEAGGLLWRLLARVGLKREDFTVANVVWQRPPGNELYDDDGYPKTYTHEAINYWKPYLLDFIQEMQPSVIIGLGRTALEVLTGFTDIGTTRGYVHWSRLEIGKREDEWDLGDDPFNRVNLNIPCTNTYHPQFLNYGNRHLSGVFLRDILAGVELGDKGWTPPKLNIKPTPTVDEFRWFCLQYSPDRHHLTYDIETPETRMLTEDEWLEGKSQRDIPQQIERASFCFDGTIGGWSIPWVEPFISMAHGLLASNGPKRNWNGRLFDDPRLAQYNCPVNGRKYDLLDLWRHLHRTLPASLAFVAPFYLTMSPYKHESHTQPEAYSATDAIVEHLVGEGIERDLRSTGQWEIAQRHVVNILALTEQMGRSGLPYDAERAKEFEKELEEKLKERVGRLQELVPIEIRPTKQRDGLKKTPKVVQEVIDDYERKLFEDDGTDRSDRPDCVRIRTGYVQRKFDVTSDDLAKGEVGEDLPNGMIRVLRYGLLEDFNPNSHLQKKALIRYFKHKLKTNRKTKQETSDDNTLKSLITTYIESTKPEDKRAVECYQLIRECVAISKVLGTYVKGWRPGADGLIHATPGIWGKMFRISWRDPNLAATVADKKEVQIASGFRKCIACKSDEVLIESDWMGQEAVILGWYAKSQSYMRIARLSLNAYFCSHLLNRPADLAWSDNDLRHYLRDIRDDEKNVKIYDDAKHTIYLIQNGGTPFLIHEVYEVPLARAKFLYNFYFEVFPEIRKLHQAILTEAHEKCRLVLPCNYRMPIWDAYTWVQSRYEKLRKLWVRFKTGTALQMWTKDEKKWLERIHGVVSLKTNGSSDGEDKAIRSLCYDLGTEAKGALSFYPRDTGSFMLKEALLELEDKYKLVTRGVLRATAHDSILALARRDEAEEVAENMRVVQEQPWQFMDGLVINVDQKFGGSWSKSHMRPMRMFRQLEAVTHA